MLKNLRTAELVNKKAAFNYILLDTFKAGIVLVGTEVKSVKEGKINLSDSFCYIREEEVWIKNLHISEYSLGTYANHVPLRLRKLLLKKREIAKLIAKTKEKGFTIVPTKVFFNDKGIIKIEIALAKGKKTYDKRETIKERDSKKIMDRALKQKR